MAAEVSVPVPQTQAAPTVERRRWAGWSWLATVDHKQIGILYTLTALGFFLIGGVEALLVRTQLIVPMNSFLQPDIYNQMFTMHATTMIFLAIMPLNVGIG